MSKETDQSVDAGRERTSADAGESGVKDGDVVQLDPEHCEWGPLLCIVDSVKKWGVTCYAFVPEKRSEPPGQMYMRVEHGHFVVVGKAEWRAA